MTETSRSSTVRLASAAAGIMVAQQVAGKAARDALFLSSFPVSAVPGAMMASALVATLSVVVVTRLLLRLGPSRVMPGIFATSAALIVAEWLVQRSHPAAAAFAVYLHTALFGAVVGSGFWSLVNESFDPRTAKRVVGRIAAGGTIGGVAGGLVAYRMAGASDVGTVLLPLAAANLACSFVTARIGVAVPTPSSRPPSRGGDEVPEIRSSTLHRNRYLWTLAAIVGLGAMVQAILDYLLNAEAVRVYGKGQALLTFFALFYTSVGVVAFAIQTTLATRVLRRFGLVGGVVTLPLTVFGLLLLQPFMPALAGIVLARGGESAIRGSLYRAGMELLLTPLPAHERRLAKPIVDVGVDRAGAAFGSLVVFGLLILPAPLMTTVLRVVTATTAIAIAYLTRALRRGYVASLERSLRDGVVGLGEEDVLDATTGRTLSATMASQGFDRAKFVADIESFRREHLTPTIVTSPGEDPMAATIAALRSPDAARILVGLDAARAWPSLAALVVPLLERDDVHAAASRALDAVAKRATGAIVDALLDPSLSPVVRRRVAKSLAAGEPRRASVGLVLALESEDFEVRRSAADALARVTARTPASAPTREALFRAVHDEIGRGTVHPLASRKPSSDGPGASERANDDGMFADVPERRDGLEHVFTLLSIAVDRDIVGLAYRAIGSGDPTLRGTALEYLEAVLPETLLRVLCPLVGEERRSRPVEHARPREEIASDLLRSRASVDHSLAMLRRAKRE